MSARISSVRGHARPKIKQDDVVLGMVERNGGRLKLVPVADTKAKILKPHLERHISENVATIYSDGSPVYVFALNQKFAGKQKTIPQQGLRDRRYAYSEH